MRTGTFGYLYINAYSITAYCTPCERRVDVALLKINPNESYLNRRFVCDQCGRLGDSKLSPPHTDMSRPYENPEVLAEMERRKAELKEKYGYE